MQIIHPSILKSISVYAVFLIPMSWLLGATASIPLLLMGAIFGIATLQFAQENNARLYSMRLWDVGFLSSTLAVYALASFNWSTPEDLSTVNARNPLLIFFGCLSVIVLIPFFRRNLVHPEQGRLLSTLVLMMGPILLALVLIDSVAIYGPLLSGSELHTQNGRINFSLSVNQNPNTASYFFGVSVLISVWAVSLPYKTYWQRGLCWVALACYSILFAICGSISAAIGLYLALVINTLLKRNRTSFYVLALVVLFGVLGLQFMEVLCDCTISNQNRAYSAGTRVEIWWKIIYVWLENPVLGHGLFTLIEVPVGEEQQLYTSHSILLNQLAGGGLLGFALTLVLAAQAFGKAALCVRVYGDTLPLCWLIFVTPILATHKYMVFLPEPYLWLIVWIPLLLPTLVIEQKQRI